MNSIMNHVCLYILHLITSLPSVDPYFYDNEVEDFSFFVGPVCIQNVSYYTIFFDILLEGRGKDLFT